MASPKGSASVDYRALVDDLGDPSSSAANDPILDAFYTGLELDVADLRRISSSVRWVKGSRPQSSLSIDRFQATKLLALFDLFSSKSEKEKRALVQSYITGGTPNSRRLSALRDKKAYQEICKKLIAARDRLQRPSTPAELVEEGASDAFRSLHDEVRMGKGKMKVIAAKEFTDRVSPKVHKGEGSGGHVLVDITMMKLLAETLQMVGEKRGEITIPPTPKQIAAATGADPDPHA